MKYINLGEINKIKNQKQQGYIKVSGTSIELPITLICGEQDGKTVLITAGIHNSEYVGIQSAMELANSIMPKQVSGNIIIAPLINRSGFENRTMSLVFEDGKNLNRVFPGGANGSISERIAYFIEKELFSIADYYIDLHCGDGFEELTPFVYCQGNAEEKVISQSKKMAESVNMDYIVESKSNKGGAYNYAGSIGLPAILIERGCLGKWSKEEVEAYKVDVKNVLNYLKVLNNHNINYKKKSKVISNIVYKDAEYTGCWYPSYKVGDTFSKGEVLGDIKDYFGNILYTCVAEIDGRVLYQTGSLCIIKGTPMIAYGER